MIRAAFFLASTEGTPGLTEPRKCIELRRFARVGQGRDHLLVRLEPPLFGQAYGLGGREINVVVLTPRLKGIDWPPEPGKWVPVHVARPLRPLESVDHVMHGDIKELGWGEAYTTADEARMDVARTALR